MHKLEPFFGVKRLVLAVHKLEQFFSANNQTLRP